MFRKFLIIYSLFRTVLQCTGILPFVPSRKEMIYAAALRGITTARSEAKGVDERNEREHREVQIV
jgi:hypothetical protein